jgi:hypothetical protein
MNDSILVYKVSYRLSLALNPSFGSGAPMWDFL